MQVPSLLINRHHPQKPVDMLKMSLFFKMKIEVLSPPPVGRPPRPPRCRNSQLSQQHDLGDVPVDLHASSQPRTQPGTPPITHRNAQNVSLFHNEDDFLYSVPISFAMIIVLRKNNHMCFI